MTAQALFQRFTDAIVDAGLRVQLLGNHAHVFDATRQRAVLRVDANGWFEWGWVETSSGREDFSEWPAMHRALVSRFGVRS